MNLTIVIQRAKLEGFKMILIESCLPNNNLKTKILQFFPAKSKTRPVATYLRASIFISIKWSKVQITPKKSKQNPQASKIYEELMVQMN